MNKGDQCLIKQLVVSLFLGFLAVSSMTMAMRPQRNDINREFRTTQQDLQKEKKRQEATQSFPELNAALKGILEIASKNQRPQPNTIEQSRQLLDDNKRNGWAYDEPQKATYMLLQAWTGFYQDNPVDAVNWSMRAAKTDATDGDAWISQALFCMLNGKRPAQPRIEKPKTQPRNDSRYGVGTRRSRQRMGEEATLSETNAASTQPYGQKGVLEFDMSLLRSEMLKKRFNRREYKSVDGSKIEYEPGQDTLCILFWQAEDTVAKANGVSGGNESEIAGEEFGMMDFAAVSQSQEKFAVENQRKYMKQVSEACKDNEQIKFLQINTDTLDKATEAAQKLVTDPHIEEAGSLVYAAEPGSGAADCIGVKAAKPFLLIVDKDGVAKYAGPAVDFMPAFILTQLTGVEIDLTKQNQTAEKRQALSPEMTELEMMDLEMMEEMLALSKSHDPNKISVDPNKPAADPNTPAIAVSPKNTKQLSDFPTQSLEDQIRAEKLLQSAQMHIEESRKLRMKNPKQGIEDARKVLEEFPNTEHAEKARDLLRRVPSRWKEPHGITDEELGY